MGVTFKCILCVLNALGVSREENSRSRSQRLKWKPREPVREGPVAACAEVQLTALQTRGGRGGGGSCWWSPMVSTTLGPHEFPLLKTHGQVRLAW